MSIRTLVALGAISLSTLLVACDSPKGGSAPQQAASQPAGQAVATSSTAGNAEMGKAIFMRTCANCHGPDGTGSMMRPMYPKIGDLTSPELHARMKDADFVNLITNGREKMPALGGVIKPDQMAHVIAYVRTLKKG